MTHMFYVGRRVKVQGMTKLIAQPPQADNRHGVSARQHSSSSELTAISMRGLGKLTADQVDQLDHPIPVTNNGLPIAWLVPLAPSERRRAEMIAAGQLRPGRLGKLSTHPLSPLEGEPTLSELILEMREKART